MVLGVMQNAQEISGGNKNCASSNFCDILAKNFDSVYQYPEDLHEAELKINGYSLVEDISEHNGECLDWLLLITLISFYDKK